MDLCLFRTTFLFSWQVGKIKEKIEYHFDNSSVSIVSSVSSVLSVRKRVSRQIAGILNPTQSRHLLHLILRTCKTERDTGKKGVIFLQPGKFAQKSSRQNGD